MNLLWKVINNVSLNAQMDMNHKKVNVFKEVLEAAVIVMMIVAAQIRLD